MVADRVAAPRVDRAHPVSLDGRRVGEAEEMRPIGGVEPVVEIAHAVKRFGDKTVIDDFSLRVAAGEIYGLIGPSGCGKTTAIRLLVGVLEPSEGEVRVMAVAPRDFTTAQREMIGYTPQGFYLYPTLTVSENARFVAGLFGVAPWRRGRRVREVLTFLELWDARNRLARDISGGMQRRLSLACALVHRPKLLFVDEPTSGLDPVLREKIWGLLRRLRDDGGTIFVTTQHIDEAVNCDTVAVMNNGRLAAIGTPEDLRERAAALHQRDIGGDVLDVQVSDSLSRADLIALDALDGVRSVERQGPCNMRLTVDDAATCTSEVMRLLSERGADVVSVHPSELGFDEVFLAIVAEDSDSRARDAAALLPSSERAAAKASHYGD